MISRGLTLLLPLDGLLVITREFIHAATSRSARDRCLRRHGVNDLRALVALANPQPDGVPAAPKTFKDYDPGFVHVDIKYLPQMPDEAQHRYLFVAIDRATRWVHIGLYDDQTEVSAVHFLEQVHQAAPMKILKLLTDNGTQFTDRFTSKTKQPTGRHGFDVRCKALGIEHRLSPPRHPQTNGMVERFIGRVTELIAQTRFKSARVGASFGGTSGALRRVQGRTAVVGCGTRHRGRHASAMGRRDALDQWGLEGAGRLAATAPVGGGA